MQSVCVLAVEDDKFCQETLKMFLTALKVDFSLASNGEEAVSQYKKRPFSLVLMDLMMPVMDGYAAAKAIRDYEKGSGLRKSKIVGLSADDDDKTIKACMSSGMDTLIKKPIKKDGIAKLL